MADTTPSQDPRKAFEHHCKTIGIDGSALERWEEGCENPDLAGQYMRSHVQLMWQTYQWRADAATQPNAALADGWISVDERLPKCPSKPGSLGVEVLIHPPMSDGSITAFYGRRQSTKPAFYKYGVLAHGVEFWMTPPAPPTLNASKEG